MGFVMTELINSAVTLVVGIFAFAIFKMTKISEKRAAATIIVMDIRHAEQVVHSILEKGMVDRSMKNILYENNWMKYKHLFANDFSYDDFASFNRFFESCVEIAEARKRMIDVFYDNIRAKAEITHQKIFSIENLESEAGAREKARILHNINIEDSVFDPFEPKNKVLQNLQLIGRLSNTVAFEKMKKIAKINK